jgi:hypothetical protein
VVPLAGLMGRLPRERWRMELMPFLDIAAALDSALEVLGLLGNRDDVPLVASYLETSFGEDSLGNMKSSAIQALTNFDDGSALPAVRRLIGDAQPGANSCSEHLST